MEKRRDPPSRAPEPGAGEAYGLVVEKLQENVVVLEAVRDGRGTVVDWTYRHVNAGARAQLGLGPDVVGKRVSEVLEPGALARVMEHWTRVLATGEEHRYEATVNGVHFLVALARVNPDAVASTAVDITDRKRAEEALARSESALAQAGTMAHLGAWWIDFVVEDDLSANPLHWSDEVYRIFGYQPREVEVSNALFFQHVHPDDRRRVTEAVAEALAQRRPYATEHRIVRRDGTERFVLEHAEVQLDAAGRPLRIVGAVQDITERMRVEEAVREGEQKYAALFDRSPFAAALTRMPEGTIVGVNDAFVKLFEYAREEVVGRTGVALGISDPESSARVAAELRARGSVRDFEAVRITKSGARRVLSLNSDLVTIRGEAFVLTTVQDVTERRRAEDALLTANTELAEANRQKNEFLAMLSHELRNPLAPIRNSIYVLEHADSGSEQAARARGIVRRQTEHLTRLVDDLLDVTRIARGKIELRRSHVDLREVVWRAADDFRLMMSDRGVSFRTALPEARLWAEADPTRITQIVGNLLHNAAKFTRRGDEVTLSLRRADGFADISVHDTGAGIEPALLSRVFEPFVQGERTMARTEGGLGLGLALVKGIAEMHGGTVRVDSAGQGRGAEFVVRIPVAGGPLKDEVHAGGGRGTKGRRVLVVDDNVDAAEALAEVVRMLGHTVEVAHDGPSALAKARASPPDVVLCDIGLPGMSGYEVARALRATRAGLQLLAVSGYALPEDVAKAIEAGFDGHLAKPVDPLRIERLLA